MGGKCLFGGLLALLVSQVQAAPLEPIPGSITYGGAPRTKLTRAPVGSTVTHRFVDAFGREVNEVYRLDEQRDLQLIRRRITDMN